MGGVSIAVFWSIHIGPGRALCPAPAVRALPGVARPESDQPVRNLNDGSAQILRTPSDGQQPCPPFPVPLDGVEHDEIEHVSYCSRERKHAVRRVWVHSLDQATPVDFASRLSGKDPFRPVFVVIAHLVSYSLWSLLR